MTNQAKPGAAAPWVAVGADGGGSHVRLAARFGGRLAQVETSGINAANDPDGAARVLRDGVAALRGELGVDGRVPTALFAGLAGAMDGALAQGVRERLPLDRVRIEDDRSIAVAGALGGGIGTVVSLGTGSFAGRVAGGATGPATRLLGGWGFRVADQASGAWLGRALLTRVVLHADGVEPGGPVVAATAAEFGSALAVSRFAVAATPGDYARFAPRVMDGADAGEADMRAVALDGAAYIAAALRTLGWVEGERLCLVGGVGHRFAPYLDAPHRAALHEPAGTALDGALARAVALAGAA